MKLCFCDTETYSECDLKTHGTPRYAEHPSTEITIAQWALDDDEPTVWDCTEHGKPPELLALLADPDVIFVFWNLKFDQALLKACWGVDLPTERCIDAMISALAHSLPGGLGHVGEVLGLPADKAKDKRGADLIQLFAKPRPKNMALRRATRMTHPAEWEVFKTYSRSDITSMREAVCRLPTWNYRPGTFEYDLWVLDSLINQRGFAVDLDLARAAIDAVAEEQRRLKALTLAQTDGLVSSPSKRDQMLRFILAEYDVDLPDLKADTLRRRMEDPELPEGVRLLLSIRLEATKTSTAKYKALVNMTSADGRMRNTMQFAGAQRTGRWAHRGPQPGNMPRPSKGFKQAQQAMGVAALKGGFADVVFGDVMQLTADCIRGCIVAPPGKKLVVADLSNIEGRVLAWLAGEQWKLRAFGEYDAGTGPDLYKATYARAFGIVVADVEDWMRQIGKVMELALGYEGGVAAFLTFAAVYGLDLDALADAVHRSADKGDLAEAYAMYEWTLKKKRSTFGLSKSVYVACELLKASWRKAHPNTKALWATAKESVTLAIGNPGVTFDIGQHLRVRRDGAWLRIRLPSGRYLCYLQPKVAEDGQITYLGVDQYTRQWKRIKTYGGKIIENVTQAVARDVMGGNMPAIDAGGYEIILSVHDELITETPDTDEFNADDLSARLAARAAWAKGLPLAAAGFETTRYIKG